MDEVADRLHQEPRERDYTTDPEFQSVLKAIREEWRNFKVQAITDPIKRDFLGTISEEKFLKDLEREEYRNWLNLNQEVKDGLREKL